VASCDAPALVLDAVDGRTSAVLAAVDSRTYASSATFSTSSSSSGVGGGFPASAIFVPNQHTHVVSSLRRDYTSSLSSSPSSSSSSTSSSPASGSDTSGRPLLCTAFAADVAEVLQRRSPAAHPLHLLYLDHCGSVAQRYERVWHGFWFLAFGFY